MAPWDWPPFGIAPRRGATEIIQFGGPPYGVEARYTLRRKPDAEGDEVRAVVFMTADGEPMAGGRVSAGPTALRFTEDASDLPSIRRLWGETFGRYAQLLMAVSAAPPQRCPVTGAWLQDAEVWP